MRGALAGLVLALGVVTPSVAAAMTGTHALPAGVDSALRFDAPAHIAAKEHVEGITVERSNDTGTSVLRVGMGQEHPSCLGTRVGAGTDGAPADSIFEYERTGVLFVRSDRLFGGASPVLEERAIAIDAGTAGARVLATRRVPLAVVARGPGELVAYAGRAPEGVLVAVTGGTRSAMRDDNGALVSNACTLSRFVLKEGSEPNKPFARAVRLLTSVAVEKKPEQGPFGNGGAPSRDNHVVSVSVSLSRGSKDPEPLLSVAVGVADARSPVVVRPSITDLLE